MNHKLWAIIGTSFIVFVTVAFIGMCTQIDRRISYASDDQVNPVLAQSGGWPEGHPSVDADVLVHLSLRPTDESAAYARLEITIYPREKSNNLNYREYIVTCSSPSDSSQQLFHDTVRVEVPPLQVSGSWISSPFRINNSERLSVDLQANKVIENEDSFGLSIEFTRRINRVDWRGPEV